MQSVLPIRKGLWPLRSGNAQTCDPLRMETTPAHRPAPALGYGTSFIVVALLLALGYLIEFFFPSDGLPLFEWPFNLFVGVGLVGVLLGFHVAFRAHPWVQGLARIPASIAAMAGMTFLVMLMGLILQHDPEPPAWVERLNLHRITRSWPFAFGSVFFLVTLGFTTLKRLTPFKGRNIGFFLNHAGLWIVLAGGLLGAGDLKRIRIDVTQQDYVWFGRDQFGRLANVPLAMQLQQFVREEFPPKLVLLHLNSNEVLLEGPESLLEVGDRIEGRVGEWNVRVLNYYTDAYPMDSRYEPVLLEGAAPAAHVQAWKAGSADTLSGWISTGSFAIPGRLLPLEGEIGLALSIPPAKRYASEVHVLTRSGRDERHWIEVNAPVRIDGWTLYQFSYDEDMGKWSTTSVIEAIRDPWLPVVYFGIFMMVAGAVYLLWVGNTTWRPHEGRTLPNAIPLVRQDDSPHA